MTDKKPDIEKMARILVTVSGEDWKENLIEAQDYMGGPRFQRTRYGPQTLEEQALYFLEADVKEALEEASRERYRGTARWFKLSFEEWEE